MFREGGKNTGDGGDCVRWGRKEVAEAMAAVKEIIEFAHGGPGEWDGVCLVVGIRSLSSGSPSEDEDEEWEDICWDNGFEYIRCTDMQATKTPAAVGENASRDKKGVDRVKEALEANDWTGGDDAGVEDGLLEDWEEGGDVLAGDGEGEGIGFTIERREMESEFRRLQFAMAGADASGDGEEAGEENEENEAMRVEELEEMMRKMIVVKGNFAAHHRFSHPLHNAGFFRRN